MTRRGLALPAGLVALAALAWAWPLQHVALWTARNDVGDVRIYLRYARWMSRGLVPYRDFHVEYPPGATVIFWLVWQLPGHYRGALSVLMLACLCMCVLGVVATARALGLSPARQAIAGGIVALSPLLLGPIVVQRFDMAVAAVTAWLVYAAVTERWKLMWGLLAAGVLIKLIPIALLPLLVIWQAHRRGWAPAIRGALTSIGFVILAVLPVLIMTPSGTWYFIDYNLRRPPQLESLTSNLFLLLSKYDHYRFRIVETFHSVGVEGTPPSVVATVSMLLLVVLVIACAWWSWRLLAHATAPADRGILVAGAAATIVALTVFGKVLSPQYMMWLLPVTLVLQGRWGRAAIPLTLAALLVTLAYFPTHFQEISKTQIYVIRLLTLRNLILVALLVVCWPRASSGRQAFTADADRPAPVPAEVAQ
jgi:hypothetical protein